MPLATGLIHPVPLSLQELPASLQGFKIAHFTDLHIAGPKRRFDHLIGQLTNLRMDLAVFTGDIMTRGADIDSVVEVFSRITEVIRPAYGMFGVFGNHDRPELADALKHTPVNWLGNGVTTIEGKPIQLLSINQFSNDAGDSAAMLLEGEPLKRDHLRLMLAHYPSWLSTAADIGVDLMLAGHTHGGQICLPGGYPLMNSCDLPLSLSSGVLRHRNTLIAISRGIGDVGFLPIRAFCPPHVPVYTLRQGPTLGRNTSRVTSVMSW